jgi:hypothetical protein
MAAAFMLAGIAGGDPAVARDIRRRVMNTLPHWLEEAWRDVMTSFVINGVACADALTTALTSHRGVFTTFDSCPT